MNIKTIEEMDNNELEKVFDNNQKLQHEVLDDMIESEMNYISEQLNEFRDSLSNWSIGTGQYCYVTVGSNLYEFVAGVKQAQASYGTLADKDMDLLTNAENLLYEKDEMESYSDEYCDARDRVEEKMQEIADTIAKGFQSQLDYCYDRESQKSYFIEFYAENRMEGTEYIKDSTFELYEDVSYTKSYN